MEKREIFDLSISIGDFQELIEESVSRKYSYSCFCNSHMIYEHHKNPNFGDVLDNADFIFPDGVPLLYSIRLLRRKKVERIAGNDVTFSLVDLAQKKDLKMFWIGGQRHILDLISQKLREREIKHQMYSPPFLPIEEFDFQKQADMIEEFDPDIIMVGLGCPKQEIWMNRMRDKVKAPMFGVGGAFLLFAGVDTRAPKWMRDLSFEWFYRLILEPKRLFKRYFITNTYFCYLFIKELMKRL